MRCPPRAAVGLLWPTALGLLPSSSSFRVQSAFSLLGMLRGRLSPDASSPAILLAPGGGRFGHSMQSPQKRCRQAPQFVQFGPPYGTLVAPNRRAAGHMMRELYSLKIKFEPGHACHLYINIYLSQLPINRKAATSIHININIYRSGLVHITGQRFAEQPGRKGNRARVAATGSGCYTLARLLC